MKDAIISILNSIIKTMMIALVISFCTGLACTAFAETTYLYPRTMPADNSMAVAVRGEFKAGQKAALDRINEIRLEACKKGYPDPYTGEPLTMDDYHPLKWSSEAEEYARLRSVEASVYPTHWMCGMYLDPPKIDDNYLDGQECLAWGPHTMKAAVEAWYSEKKNYVGSGSGQTGHYMIMIDPDKRYIGLSTFDAYGDLGCRGNSVCTSGQFVGELTESDAAGDESMMPAIKDATQIISVYNDYVGKPYMFDLLNPDDCGDKYFSPMQTVEVNYAIVRDVKIDKYNSKVLDFKDYTYASSNPSVVAIDSTGKGRTLQAGTSIITATDSDGTQYSTKVKVWPLFDKPAIKKAKRSGKKIKVTLDMDDIATGFQLQFARDKKFTKVLRTVKGKAKRDKDGDPMFRFTKAFKKPKGKGSLYVRVRIYKVRDGYTYYTYWSKVKKVK